MSTAEPLASPPPADRVAAAGPKSSRLLRREQIATVPAALAVLIAENLRRGRCWENLPNGRAR